MNHSITSLLVAVCVLESISISNAALTATQSDKNIVIESNGKLNWRLVIDGTVTGDITNFCIPADGKNAVKYLCDAFYLGKLKDGTGNRSGKGNISQYGKLDSARIVSQSDDKIVVETKGSSTGRALSGPKGE